MAGNVPLSVALERLSPRDVREVAIRVLHWVPENIDYLPEEVVELLEATRELAAGRGDARRIEASADQAYLAARPSVSKTRLVEASVDLAISLLKPGSARKLPRHIASLIAAVEGFLKYGKDTGSREKIADLREQVNTELQRHVALGLFGTDEPEFAFAEPESVEVDETGGQPIEPVREVRIVTIEVEPGARREDSPADAYAVSPDIVRLFAAATDRKDHAHAAIDSPTTAATEIGDRLLSAISTFIQDAEWVSDGRVLRLGRRDLGFSPKLQSLIERRFELSGPVSKQFASELFADFLGWVVAGRCPDELGLSVHDSELIARLSPVAVRPEDDFVQAEPLL